MPQKKDAFSYLLSQDIIRLYYTREKRKEKKRFMRTHYHP